MRARPTTSDWVLAGVFTLLSLLAPRVGGPEQSRPGSVWAGLLALGLALAEGIPTAWRRIRPRAVAAVVVSAYAAYVLVAYPAPPYAGWAAVFAVIVHVERRRHAVLLGAAAAVVLAAASGAAAVVHPEGLTQLLPLLLLTVVVVLAAALTRTERGRLTALRERALSLERERDAVRGQAALEERLRIARDLHDVVGHGLSAIAVQSGTGRVALDAGRLDAVRTALVNVEATSRSALQEMRALVGVLREDNRSVPGEQRAAPVEAPSIRERSDLTDLVAQTPGLRATVACRGDLTRLPRPAGQCVYRVVQESLTNAVRHAPRAPARVEVAVTQWQVVVEVTTGAAPPQPVQASAPGGGHGVIGMRERVQALRGTLEAGPCPGGGWRVRAIVPLDQNGPW